MEISLVRHALAAERDTFDGADEERPLTSRGRKQCKQLAEILVAGGWQPTCLFTSPLLRCMQTAEILRKAIGLKPRETQVVTWLRPGMHANSLVKELDAFAEVLPEHAAIVGHEPDLSECAALLIGGGRLKFAKSTIAQVHFEDQPRVRKGELRWLVSPRLFSAEK